MGAALVGRVGAQAAGKEKEDMSFKVVDFGEVEKDKEEMEVLRE